MLIKFQCFLIYSNHSCTYSTPHWWPEPQNYVPDLTTRDTKPLSSLRTTRMGFWQMLWRVLVFFFSGKVKVIFGFLTKWPLPGAFKPCSWFFFVLHIIAWVQIIMLRDWRSTVVRNGPSLNQASLYQAGVIVSESLNIYSWEAYFGVRPKVQTCPLFCCGVDILDEVISKWSLLCDLALGLFRESAPMSPKLTSCFAFSISQLDLLPLFVNLIKGASVSVSWCSASSLHVCDCRARSQRAPVNGGI